MLRSSDGAGRQWQNCGDPDRNVQVGASWPSSKKVDFPQKPLFSPAPSTGPQLAVVTNSVQTHCSEETNKQKALKSQIFRETFYFRQLFHIGLNLNTRVQVCASCSRCSMPARALSEIKRDRGRWSFPKHCSHPESSGSSFEVVSLQHQPSAGCS